MSKAIEENKLTVMITTKRTYLLPLSTHVKTFLIDEKLLSLSNFQTFSLVLLTVL